MGKSSAGCILIGAGGHAGGLLDIMKLLGMGLTGYVDPNTSPHMEAAGIPQVSEASLLAMLPSRPNLVMGFVGITTESLGRRLNLMNRYMEGSARFPALIHPSAVISPQAEIGAGAQVMPGVVINARAKIGAGAVINCNATVEHDAEIADGAHIAPAAIVLGGARIGQASMIGAGAVVIQQASVPAAHFVKSLAVYK